MRWWPWVSRRTLQDVIRALDVAQEGALAASREVERARLEATRLRAEVEACRSSEANSHGQMREAKRALERSQHDLEVATDRLDWLTREMVKMRRRGFDAPPEVRRSRPQEEVEKVAVKRAEAMAIRADESGFKERATAALTAEGVDPVTAEREAQRLFDEAVAFQQIT